MQNNRYPPLEPGRFYHIYNRGNNSQTVFHTEFEVNCFLDRWNRFIAPVADTFAFNILPNHFHATIRTRETIVRPDTYERETLTTKELNRAFSRFFISFAMALHAANGSNGAIFKRRFQRKEVETEAQFQRVIAYVLFNAQRHRLTDTPRSYRNGSFRFLGKTAPPFLAQDELYALFGGLSEIEAYLAQYQQHYFPVSLLV